MLLEVLGLALATKAAKGAPRAGRRKPRESRQTATTHAPRITENPFRSYASNDLAGTQGSTIIPSTSASAAMTYGEAAFNFSAETNT